MTELRQLFNAIDRNTLMTSHKTRHQHTAAEERRIREAALDQTIEGSFPASDPPSTDPNPDDHSALERERPPADKNRNST